MSDLQVFAFLQVGWSNFSIWKIGSFSVCQSPTWWQETTFCCQGCSTTESSKLRSWTLSSNPQAWPTSNLAQHRYNSEASDLLKFANFVQPSSLRREISSCGSGFLDWLRKVAQCFWWLNYSLCLTVLSLQWSLARKSLGKMLWSSLMICGFAFWSCACFSSALRCKMNLGSYEHCFAFESCLLVPWFLTNSNACSAAYCCNSLSRSEDEIMNSFREESCGLS